LTKALVKIEESSRIQSTKTITIITIVEMIKDMLMLQSLSGSSLPSPKNQKNDPIIRPIDAAVESKV